MALFYSKTNRLERYNIVNEQHTGGELYSRPTTPIKTTSRAYHVSKDLKFSPRLPEEAGFNASAKSISKSFK